MSHQVQHVHPQMVCKIPKIPAWYASATREDTSMTILDQEIAAYEKMRPELENRHMGEWVIFLGERLIGLFASFDEAAKHAVHAFGRGPYLIRQVGAPPVTIP